MIKELIARNRSYRRFDEAVKISSEQILKWIDLARLSGSGRNAQPLQFAVVTNSELCAKIFPYLGWAGYLSNWKGPAEGERPVAYIAVIKNREIADNHYCDDGIAMQSILLGAVEAGFGGCMIGSVNKAKVAKLLGLEERHELLWIIALGKPTEIVVIDEAENGNIKYWRDEKSVHHVPKRPINEIVILTDKNA
ncbi:nitroreductase family protein [Draconibacterium halophilum]|uniref:Nitroreductase family protein n=1 Tax=Draconibacterium halophilum TaxID=2706887 RepID=A0A6C0RBX6_9BACT|nr:nitroreductase family protein [Draconibacterium halophilum]QIA07599.1 nitroreductase family protein [Draconibacterium halophilum]